MDSSENEDDDFIIKRAAPVSNLFHITTTAVSPDHNEITGPVTPPMDHSLKLNKSLGLMTSPRSPLHARVRSMELLDTPKFLRKNRLDVPTFSSTPTPTTCANRLPRSLKVPRVKGISDVKEKLNSTCGSVPLALVNPYSPFRSRLQSTLPKKSPIVKKKIDFDTDDESDSDDHAQNDLKRVKLSDFDCPHFERAFMVLGVLGTGAHGCVYKCFHLLNGMEYAVKRSLRPVNNEKLARNEIFAHAALEHPNIVRNYASWTHEDYVFLQNEYCNGGSLEEHISEKGLLQEKELMSLLEQISQGLRYIHECNLAHMDIKPGNIFLNKGPKLFYNYRDPPPDNEEDSKDEITYKIGDLGHVIALGSKNDFEEGDCRYFPREILDDHSDALIDYTKVDIFALGLTLYEAAGGGPLPKNGDEWHKIRDGYINSVSQLSSKFNRLLKKMIDQDPKKRPSASELLQEKFHEELMRDRELKAANLKIHLLEHQLSNIVKTVSKTVNANAVRSSHGKKLSTNNNNNIVTSSATGTSGRYTRSTSRLIKNNITKTLNSC